jgi:hypothetical protein
MLSDWACSLYAGWSGCLLSISGPITCGHEGDTQEDSFVRLEFQFHQADSVRPAGRKRESTQWSPYSISSPESQSCARASSMMPVSTFSFVLGTTKRSSRRSSSALVAGRVERRNRGTAIKAAGHPDPTGCPGVELEPTSRNVRQTLVAGDNVDQLA